jgi:hypothetical protein
LNGASAQSLANEWTTRYQSAPDNSMLELLNFVLAACGSTRALTLDDYHDTDHLKKVIDAIVKDTSKVYLGLSWSHG